MSGQSALQAAGAARSLGWIELSRRDYEAALTWFERAQSGTDRRRAEALSLQALALLRLARIDEARERSEKALTLARTSAGGAEDDLGLAANEARHGAILLAAEEAGRAVEALRAAWSVLSAGDGVARPVLAGAELSLGRALVGVGQVEEGESILRASLERYERLPALDPEDLELAQRALAELQG